MDNTKQFYERSYREDGFGAQRRYPNEEFCRFLGSNWLNCTSLEERAALNLLEVGAGSGSNLWVAAREGFTTYGLELAAEGVELCKAMCASWQVTADIRQGDMTAMPYEDSFFDVVCDIFSANCLPYDRFLLFLNEVYRVLKPEGKLFFYTPSTRSDAFINHEPAKLLDTYTLDGIKRESSPFTGNLYPFRFMAPESIPSILENHGFLLERLELVGKTYHSREEYFEFAVCTAIKK